MKSEIQRRKPMNKLPQFTAKSYLVALLLGAVLHLTGQEVAQYMAAGRVIDCIQDSQCTQYAPPSLIEQVLGFRFNLGMYRMNAFVQEYLDNQAKTVDDNVNSN